MPRLSELSVAISVTGVDQSLKEIRRLETGQRDLVEKNKKVGESLKEVTDSSSLVRFGENYRSMIGNIVSAAAPALAAIGAVKTAFDWAQEGAEIEFAASKFDRLASSIGTTGAALRADIIEASRGVKSSIELTTLASQVMSLKLAKSHEDVVRLATVASALNMDMGQLTLSLANQSTLRLDQLGLSVEAVTAKFEALKSLGLEEGKAYFEAFVTSAEEAIKVQGHVADSTLGTFQRLKAAFDDFFSNLKTDLLNNGLIGMWVEDLTRAFEGANLDRQNKQLVEIGKNLGVIPKLTATAINAPILGTSHLRETWAKRVEDYLESAEKAAPLTQKWADANDRVWAGSSSDLTQATEQVNQYILSILDYQRAVGESTGIGKNFKAIVGYAQTYDTVIEQLSEKEAEYTKLRNAGWSETSDKLSGLKGEIDDLNGKISASANQMTLDMMQATISIGGITQAEMNAYFDMAVGMGTVSREGADAAMKAYGSAVEQINAYALDPKTLIVDVQTNAVDNALSELETERIKTQVVEFVANTPKLDDKLSYYENLQTLQVVADFAADTLGLDAELDAYEAMKLAMTMGIVGDATDLENKLSHYEGLTPEQITVSIVGEWYIPPAPAIGPAGFGTGGTIPGNAIGGPVQKGRPYIVGEQGRELFIPETRGRVASNVEVGQIIRMALGEGSSVHSTGGKSAGHVFNIHNNVSLQTDFDLLDAAQKAAGDLSKILVEDISRYLNS